jgi:hypothetical protein
MPDGEAATYLLGVKYLEALPSVTQGAGSTIFLPAEASGVLSALGGLREMLKRTASTQAEGQPAGARPPTGAGYTPPRIASPMAASPASPLAPQEPGEER